MNEVLYHSFFQDQDYKSLKHSVLYFDRLVIADNSYPVIFGPNNSEIRLARSIPENISCEIEMLKKEKLVSTKEFKGLFDTDVGDYVRAVNLGRQQRGSSLECTEEDLDEIFRYLSIRPDFPNSVQKALSLSSLASSILLMELSRSGMSCCIDNQLVYQQLNAGLRYALELGAKSVSSESLEKRRLAANLMAQKVMSMNLPSFEFSSFDDILELKHRHKDELLALDNYLLDMSEKIEPLPFEKGYDKALSEVVERRVQPAIDELRSSVKFSPNRVVAKAYHPLKDIGLTIGFATGLPAYIQEVVSCGIGLTLLESMLLERYELRKEIKRSPLRIFLKV